jgi:GTP pyrophosphokinase
VASSQARSKIKAWYRRARREESIALGREKLEDECRRLGVEALVERDVEALAKELNYANATDLHAAVGYGDLGAETVVRRLRGEPLAGRPRRKSTPRDQGSLRMAISVGGVTDLLFRLSKCCAPVPGDAIAGFITRGRGVTVHRTDCANLIEYARREPDRVKSLEWSLSSEAYFPVVVEVDALDRVGLLSDITAIISEQDTNIIDARVRTGGKPKMARFTLTLEVKDLDHLRNLVSRVAALSDVLRVERARRA